MSRTSFEEELSHRLTALADLAPTEPTHPLRTAQRRGRQRWLVPVAAAAIIATIAGLGIWSLADRDPGSDVVTTEPPTTTPALAAADQGWSGIGSEWAPLPDGPADGRVFPVSVWTGAELIVWGGEVESETTWADDGAAFNPASGRWRAVADSPLSPRSEHVAVWTGDEVIICCGRAPSGDGNTAAAYDPGEDSWRDLSPPPFEADLASAVWTGREMIVAGGSNFTGAAAYDPSTDTWSMLAAPPATIERMADVAWTGEHLIVWPREFTSAPGLIHNRATDEWRQLPPLPPSLAVSRGSMVWTGTDIVVWGATANSEGSSVGARIGLNEDGWRAIAEAPLGPYDRWEGTDGSSSAIWTGTEMLVWAGAVGADIDAATTATLAYDPSTDSWRELDDADATWHHPQMLWTGEVAVVVTAPLLAIVPDADARTSTTPPHASIGVEELPDPIDLSVLSVRPNRLSLAVTDLRARTTETYPPGSTALGPDAASGASVTPRGDVAVWVGGAVYVFPAGDLSGEPVVLSPTRTNLVPGVALELFVQPDPAGERLWIVQPGSACHDEPTQTIVEHVDIDTGEVLASLDLPDRAFPVGETDRGLIANLHTTVSTGDGCIVDPASHRIGALRGDGTMEDLGPGVAIATWENHVVLTPRDGSEIIIRNLDDDTERNVTIPEAGTWSDVGGPAIPSTAQPLPGVSTDGRLLVANTGPERDAAGEATTSALYAIDLTTGQPIRLAEFGDWAPLATWSKDGNWVLLVRGRDLELLDPADGTTIYLPEAVPDEHFVLGAG